MNQRPPPNMSRLQQAVRRVIQLPSFKSARPSNPGKLTIFDEEVYGIIMLHDIKKRSLDYITEVMLGVRIIIILDELAHQEETQDPLRLVRITLMVLASNMAMFRKAYRKYSNDKLNGYEQFYGDNCPWLDKEMTPEELNTAVKKEIVRYKHHKEVFVREAAEKMLAVHERMKREACPEGGKWRQKEQAERSTDGDVSDGKSEVEHVHEAVESI
ncbi:MAG: hypothetical protein Q9218_002553 [Villophora microphyllina]